MRMDPEYPDKVALVDIDGTLCPSLFANVKHDDNSKFDDGFLEELRNVESYPWVGKWDWKQYTDITAVTGRLTEWNAETAAWMEAMVISRHDFLGLYGCATDRLVNVEWDDSLPTREASYNDYVRRKTLKLVELIARYNGEGYHVDVFEDDVPVMNKLTTLHVRMIGVFDFTRYIVEDGDMSEMNLIWYLT